MKEQAPLIGLIDQSTIDQLIEMDFLETQTINTGNNTSWKVYQRHAGFDLPASESLKDFDTYVLIHHDENGQPTGHIMYGEEHLAKPFRTFKNQLMEFAAKYLNTSEDGSSSDELYEVRNKIRGVSSFSVGHDAFNQIKDGYFILKEQRDYENLRWLKVVADREQYDAIVSLIKTRQGDPRILTAHPDSEDPRIDTPRDYFHTLHQERKHALSVGVTEQMIKGFMEHTTVYNENKE